MRRRILRRIGLLVLSVWCVTLLWGVAPTAAQPDDVPYIYYYSDKINGFVIERADGTDTRVLGQGVMQHTEKNAYGYLIDGPGWSPSGEWFAWTVADKFPWNYSGFRPYILKSDGTKRLTALDNFRNTQMAWSPKEDVLLVANQDMEHDPEKKLLHTFIALIRPATGDTTVIKRRTLKPYYSYESSELNADVSWLPDGTGIVLYPDEPLELSSITLGWRQAILVIPSDGKVIEKHIDNVVPATFTWPAKSDFHSVRGDFAYFTDDSLIVENLLTGQRRTFEKPTSLRQLQIDWSPNGRYALLFADKVWLLSVDHGQLNPLFEPEESVLTPRFVGPTWSPDMRYALTISKRTLMLIDLDQKTTRPLISTTKDNVVDWLHWRWIGPHQAVVHKAIDTHDEQAIFTIHDFATGKEHSITPTESPSLYGPFEITPDERYLAFMKDGPVIYDTKADSYQFIRPSADAYFTSPGGEVNWAKSNRWLLIFDDALVAGGGYFRQLGIVRRDGAYRRDLGFAIAPRAISLDWLPTQVKPTTLPPPLKKPLFPIPRKIISGTAWIDTLLWSPDQKALAGSLNTFESDPKQTVYRWDVATGKQTQTGLKFANGEGIVWQQTDSYAYEPVVVENPQFRQPIKKYVSPDGKQAIAIDDDSYGGLTVYNTVTKKSVKALGSNWVVKSVSFSPDGRLVAIGDAYDGLRIWDTETWQLRVKMPFAAPAVAFSPDGKTLAASAAWDIHLYDVAELLEYGVR